MIQLGLLSRRAFALSAIVAVLSLECGCGTGNPYAKGFSEAYHGVADTTTVGAKYQSVPTPDSAVVLPGPGTLLTASDRGNSSVNVELVDGLHSDFDASTLGNPVSLNLDVKPLYLSPDVHLITLDINQYVPSGAGVAYRGTVAVGLGVDAVSLESYVKFSFLARHTYRITANRTEYGFDVTLWDETGLVASPGKVVRPRVAATWQFDGARHFVTTLLYAGRR